MAGFGVSIHGPWHSFEGAQVRKRPGSWGSIGLWWAVGRVAHCEPRLLKLECCGTPLVQRSSVRVLEWLAKIAYTATDNIPESRVMGINVMVGWAGIQRQG